MSIRFVIIEESFFESRMNLFLNGYQQPENKLTYNFLCLLEHMPSQKEFLEFLIDKRFALWENPLIELAPVMGGFESNPDGLIILQASSGEKYKIFLENKTFRLQLSTGQLKNHLSQHCNDEKSFLLVITPRINDELIAKNVDERKIFFKTWSQIASKLLEIDQKTNESFIISQFIEYGKLKREFENMQLSKQEIDSYILYHKANVKHKLLNIIESGLKDLEFSKYGILELEKVWADHWGRLGIEMEFKRKQNFGQWFFFGIYYDNYDHKIPFKQDNEPELAFFFDCEPSHKGKLKDEITLLGAFERLLNQGFEENLIKRNTSNKWRLLFKRKPLAEIENFTPDFVRNYMEKVLADLTKEPAFVEILL